MALALSDEAKVTVSPSLYENPESITLAEFILPFAPISDVTTAFLPNIPSSSTFTIFSVPVPERVL